MQEIYPTEWICGYVPIYDPKGDTDAERNADLEKQYEVKYKSQKTAGEQQENSDLETKRKRTITSEVISVAITIPVYTIGVIGCHFLAKKYL
jgi:hypothetical protein